MRSPRFRLRSLLIAVAAVGLLLGAGIWAERMRQDARRYRAIASALARQYRASAADTAKLRGRFEYAASRPWIYPPPVYYGPKPSPPGEPMPPPPPPAP